MVEVSMQVPVPWWQWWQCTSHVCGGSGGSEGKPSLGSNSTSDVGKEEDVDADTDVDVIVFVFAAASGAHCDTISFTSNASPSFIT